MPVQRHKTAIRTCQIHIDAPMYFYVCNCGLHSQCWPTRATAAEMARLHSQCWPTRATAAEMARLHANPPTEAVT